MLEHDQVIANSRLDVAEPEFATPLEWFDLASPWCRQLYVTQTPSSGVFEAMLKFTSGLCPEANGLVMVAKGSRCPCVVNKIVRHEDGTIARCRILWVWHTLDNAPEVFSLYFGNNTPSFAKRETLVTWDSAGREVSTPSYRARIALNGALSSLTMTGIDEEVLGSSGICPMVVLRGGWLASDSQREERISLEPEYLEYAIRLSWQVADEAMRLDLRYRFLPHHIELEYVSTLPTGAGVLPLTTSLRVHAGRLVALEDWHVALEQAGSTLVRQGELPFEGFQLSSQAGLICCSLDSSQPLDLLILNDTRADGALTGLGYSQAKSLENEVSGRFAIVPTPFNGSLTLDSARKLQQQLRATDATQIEAHDRSRPTSLQPTSSSVGRALRLQVNQLSLTATPQAQGSYALRLERAGKLLLETTAPFGLGSPKGDVWAAPQQARLEADRLILGSDVTDAAGCTWRISSIFSARLVAGQVLFEEIRTLEHSETREAEISLMTAWDSQVGNPDWQIGQCTVFIPGQMARGNHHTEQPHGGGPKWGRSVTPTLCPHCKQGIPGYGVPGHADGWSFAASRLPNAWVAAADAACGMTAMIGTTTRSSLGETSVAFRSPADQTTRLSLSTPTQYAPWTPLGYGQMGGFPTRHFTRVKPLELVQWQIFYGGEVTHDLNAWAGFDRALYQLNAANRGAPRKLSLESSLETMVERLYSAHYSSEQHLIQYSDLQLGTEGLGFTGMGASAVALLLASGLLERPEWALAGTAVLNRIADACLEAPDFPFAYITSSGYQGGGQEPGYVVMAGLDCLITALSSEEQHGRTHPHWREAIEAACDAWLRVQREDGAFPHRHPVMGNESSDYESTNIEVGVIGCLVAAHGLLGKAEYLASAQRAAPYYGHLLEAGQLYGGPGDIEALTNSEVPMWYLRSFVRLWDSTNDEQHRAWALTSAAWRFAFQFGHSWSVDFGSALFRQGWCGLGGEAASASNAHMVAFGALNLEDYRLLYALSHDKHILERYRDLLQYTTQQFSRFEGDLGMPKGASVESFWATESVHGKGFIKVFDGVGHMAWVSGYASLGIALHLIDEQSKQGNQYP